MLIIKHSIKTKAKPEAIWLLWENVSQWPKWDHGIEASNLNGPFKLGSKGWLKPRGGPKVKFEMIEVTPLLKFHDRSYLPLTQLDFFHTIEHEGDCIIVTHEVEMTGWLTFLFSKVIGTGIKKDMPSAMEKLVRMAEELK